VIKVEGEKTVIDLQNNQTSATFDQELLQEIPSGRDPWSTVAQMPGATSSTFDVAGNNSYQQSTIKFTVAPQQNKFTASEVHVLRLSPGRN
jgi:hypothetical protein